MNPEEVWGKFKNLPLWLKIIAFLPMVLLILGVGAFVLLQTRDIDSSPDLIAQEKEKIGQKVKDYDNTYKIIAEERKNIAKKREKIRKELENEKLDYSNTIDSIDNASDNELSGIAAELRAKSSKGTN